MIRYVAFLRGINVSGQKLIKMEVLRQYFELPGFKNIVTYIQSGNVLFDTRETDEIKLTNKIEKQLEKQLGYKVPVVLRSIEQIKSVIDNNPFSIESLGEKKLYVHFLSGVPERSQYAALDPYKNAGEELHITGDEIYFVAASFGNTRITNSVIEKKLGVTTTARKWATVNKILKL